MKRIHLLLVYGLSFATLSAAQDIACKFNDYRILDKQTLYVLCDGPLPPTKFTAKGELFIVQDESIVHPAVEENVVGDAVVDLAWLRFTFPAPLEPNKDYELQFAGTVTLPDMRKGATPDLQQQFSKARFRFTTKPQATIGPIPGAHNDGLQSHIALQPSSAAGGRLSQKNAVGKFEDMHATFEALQDSTPPENIEYIGSLRIAGVGNLPGPFKIDGLLDIFGQTPVVDPSKHAPPISIPKSKADAAYYVNFIHEAGWGITPAWVADVKIAPLLGRLPGDLYWAPSLLVNVGNGSVGSTTTTDLIKPSIGVSRFILAHEGIFEGVQLTPSFSYETDRENDKRNALVDGDLRVYLKGLSNTKADRALDAFLKLRAKDPKAQQEDVKADFGYSVQLFLGAEAGGALADITAMSSDKSSKVVVPAYSIARVRPRAVATLEWKAITISLSLTPRYLFTQENVTRQMSAPQSNGSVKQRIFLDTVSGWHPYAECSVNFAIDPAGHYAIGTTYKVGSQPPNFDKANLFQSGLLIRF